MFEVYEVGSESCQVLVCVIGVFIDLGGKSNEQNINLYFIYLHVCLCRDCSGRNMGV
ncbi:MAG: hypothetical protein QG641_1255 [Candidatus Poribacteria bacterium]|nr:hypothetical protein [Candidatus Poribacteria bacterium]